MAMNKINAAVADRQMLEMALVGYQAQVAEIEGKVAEIRRQLGGGGGKGNRVLALTNALERATSMKLTSTEVFNVGSGGSVGGNGQKKRKGTHKISKEGRERIAAAQRKRWAKSKRQAKVTNKSVGKASGTSKGKVKGKKVKAVTVGVPATVALVGRE